METGKPVNLKESRQLSFEEKLTSEEREAFFEQSSDRAMAIIWAAIVENHVTAVLRLLMRRDEPSISAELFRPTGALGTFGTKLRVGYMLRIVTPELYNDLLIVSKIRNAFAHDLSKTSFDDQQISAFIKNMHTYDMVKKMGDEAKERIEKNESRGTIDHVASGFNTIMRDSYRNTIRFLLHAIIDFENSIKFTEESLNQSQPEPLPETE